MPKLTYGDFMIIEIALVSLMKGVNEDSELGKQLFECIAKIDLFMIGIRAEQDKNIQ